MEIATIGLDLAKNVYQVHWSDAHGKAVLRKQLRRDQVAAFFANVPRFMFPAAMAGPTRAMLEGGAPPKMLRALRGHLESLCLRYLQHEALRP